MIARFVLALPFYVALPEGAQFFIYTYMDEDYSVSIFPPARSDRPPLGDAPTVLQMNSESAFLANGLRIDFNKDTFDRRHEHPSDPPAAVITRAIESFLTRLRYVTQYAHMPPFDMSRSWWRLRYLNDDGTELTEDPALRRGLGSIWFNWSWAGINEQIWENIHSLPPDYNPPAWNGLLLDAIAALPHIGTAVVLAATCLEVFISQILDDLAKESQFSAELWKWMNERKPHDRQPSTEEQFDVLLRHFTGHSLKEESSLWEAFQHLRTARNTFVHNGVAQIGGKPISPTDAAKLVRFTQAIIHWVRELLADKLKWPTFEPSIVFTFEQAFL
jgi:hypothetical protein